MTIKSGLGHSQQRREFIPVIIVSGLSSTTIPGQADVCLNTTHTHTPLDTLIDFVTRLLDFLRSDEEDSHLGFLPV